MKRFSTRLYLVLLVVLASPVACFAADPEEGMTLWDWIVLFFTWASGGWHGM